MRSLLLFILLGFRLSLNAQPPPVIQWQKCIGGSSTDITHDIKPTPDGGYVIAGFSFSNDGDVSVQRGLGDVLVVKTDALGNVQWSRTYGGSSQDAALKISITSDGGYILTGTTLSNDGDIQGYHGGTLQDIWVVKIDAVGNLQWQRALGGTQPDFGFHIIQTSDGGYLVSGNTRSTDGDLSGVYSGMSECWLVKLDVSGNLVWQKRFGGTSGESSTILLQTTDGGYIFAASSTSTDGDVTCGVASKIWLVKLDNATNIGWQKCSGLNVFLVNSLLPTSDGGFIMTGLGNGGLGSTDAWVWKTDQAGNTAWQRFFGGSGNDEVMSVQQLSDGSYVIAGSTNSPEVDTCNLKGLEDLWIFQLNGAGIMQWQKRFGSTMSERPTGYTSPPRILPTPDGGFIVAGNTSGNDADVSGNHGLHDIWLVKFSAPNSPVLPTIAINADKTNICSGSPVRFIATTTNGGNNPAYQWKVNGNNSATNNDSVTIRIFNNGDIVSCVLTSSSGCVTSNTANSNSIAITVDPALSPFGFLQPDTTICRFDRFLLKSNQSFASYLWSNNSIDSFITVKQGGIYWLEVTDTALCSGRDSLIVSTKECLTDFFMPTAFSPNNDGLNDILKPIFANLTVEKYKLAIYDRWGQIVFESTDPNKGWNGKVKGQSPDAHVFVWVCNFKLTGEIERMEKGTVVLIK